MMVATWRQSWCKGRRSMLSPQLWAQILVGEPWTSPADGCRMNFFNLKQIHIQTYHEDDADDDDDCHVWPKWLQISAAVIGRESSHPTTDQPGCCWAAGDNDHHHANQNNMDEEKKGVGGFQKWDWDWDQTDQWFLVDWSVIILFSLDFLGWRWIFSRGKQV